MPAPVWVRGEVSGFRRTPGGAAFFRLVDPDSSRHSLAVAGRGRIVAAIDRSLDAAGVGRLRDGVEIRAAGTVDVDPARSSIRLSLLDLDPEFTLGRLAGDRDALLRRLEAAGTLSQNRRLPLPSVPLRVGLVTSRGSAAHSDFCGQLTMSGFRFRVSTVHASVQGDGAERSIVRAIERLGSETLDVVTITRGGGAKLDLAAFDGEAVARAIASSPHPVVTGIGHEIDVTVADHAASVAVKTPTAAAEWLIARVGDFANRVDSAASHIARQAKTASDRATHRLETVVTAAAAAGEAIGRHRDRMDQLAAIIATAARTSLIGAGRDLEQLSDLIGALGLEATLRRGFAIVTDSDGRIVRSVEHAARAGRLSVRVADGTFPVTPERSS